MKAEILIVDDEADIRNLMQGILEDEGYVIRQAANSQQAFEQLENCPPHLVILDIWLQNSERDGLEILRQIKEDHPFMPVVMISGHGTIETAVSAIKDGAYDFVEKPFKSDRLLLMIERALETAKLKRENEALRLKAEGPSELIGSSPAMTALRQALSRVAQTNSRILLTGEAGTGKDIAARTIHKMSQRAEEPFMVLNCAILRPEHLEIELFGSESGTMGEPAKTGVLEQANGGTLLLDEVADMPLETQGKIVRVLQEQRFQKVGSQTQIEVDVRIIASTNRDLKALIQEEKFREDLFYRLNVVPITLPPLYDRLQDIPELANHFASVYSKQSGMPLCEFSESALATMQAYNWPGNVRQLRNVIEWAMIMGEGDDDGVPKIDASQLPPEMTSPSNKGDDDAHASIQKQNLIAMSLRDARETFERDYLEAQIKRFGGNISKTAQFVGMERSALHRKLKQLGISEPSKQSASDNTDKKSLQDNRKIA